MSDGNMENQEAYKGFAYNLVQVRASGSWLLVPSAPRFSVQCNQDRSKALADFQREVDRL